MSTQYKDGTFSEIEPIDEAFETFKDALESGTARSFHVGTEEQVRQQQIEAKLAAQVNDISQRLANLEADKSIIQIPPEEMVNKIIGKLKG